MGYILYCGLMVIITACSVRLSGAALLKCGLGQCVNNTVCCPGEKECCSDLHLCCGENCCRQGYECCQGSARCCKTASSCCGGSTCCPENTKCCPNKRHCCPLGHTCCGDSEGCCPDNTQCCGDYCCAANTKCCPDATGCYSDGFYCCGNGLACPEGTECCGNQCCQSGTQCCGDTCCNITHDTTTVLVAVSVSAIHPPYNQTPKPTWKPVSGQTNAQTGNPDQSQTTSSGIGLSDGVAYLLFPIVAGVAVISVVIVCCLIVKKTDGRASVAGKVKEYAKKMKEIVVNTK